jgi:hypothetical protein
MMQAAPGRPERNDRSDQPDRPRFRQDLLAELVDEQDARFIDVMDPDSGTMFRFYEVEYSLACGMDGERDVPGIVRWAHDELGLTPSQQEVRTVIATLGGLGFIAAGEAAAQPSAAEIGAGVLGVPSVSDVRDVRGVPGVSVPSQATVPASLGFDTAGRAAAASPSQPSAMAASPPQVSEVSIDLSDHIEIRPADVKEAVRASRVMAAVDVPRELREAIEDRPVRSAPPALASPSDNLVDPLLEVTKPGLLAKRPEMARSPRIIDPRVPASAPAPPEITRPPEAPKPVAEQHDVAAPAKPPVELPAPPIAQPVPPPAPRTRTSPVLIVLLLLAVLGGGAFLVWKYVLEKRDAGVPTGAVTSPPPVKPLPPPPPPPPPPAPASTIAMETSAPDEIKLARSGQIETILADGTAVKAGDVVVRLYGDKPIEAEIAVVSGSVTRLQAQIGTLTKRRDTAQAAGNKAAEAGAEADLAERQKVLAAKQELLSTDTANLEKYLIHAPDSGTFTPVAKIGQKLAADSVVAKLQREAVATATFRIADTSPFTANANVEVSVGTGEQRVTCTIAEVQPSSVKVTCPVDPALTDGTAVTLKVAGAPESRSSQPPGPSQPPASGSSVSK